MFRTEKVSILHYVSASNGRRAVSVTASKTVLLEGDTFSSDGAVDKFDGFEIFLSDREAVWSSRLLEAHPIWCVLRKEDSHSW